MNIPSQPYFNSALSNSLTTVKASTCEVYSVNVYNPNAAGVFVQMFDAAAGNVTLGTTTPTHSFFVPAQASIDMNMLHPRVFSVALVIAATTTATGSGAPTTGVVVNMGIR